MRLPPAPTTLTPAAFWLWGRVALGGGFALLFALVLYLTWTGAAIGLFGIAAAVLGVAALVTLFRHPLLNLAVVLSGFIVVADHAEGIQATEALYGLYYMAFLAHWFFTRLVLRREAIFERAEDKAIFVFLIGVTLSFGLTVLFGGSLRGAFSEWIALIVLAFYFPIKEACLRYRRGVHVVLGVLAFIGIFAALRNALEYQGTMRSAERVYEITTGRVITNDALLMVTSVMSLTVLIFCERLKHRLALLGVFLLVFGGLILTLSRGFWVGFVAGAGLLFLLVPVRHKLRLLALAAAGLSGFLAIGLVFFGEYLTLVLSGLVERFASIGSATTKDISLMARIFESKAVWAKVQANPILGYGLAAPFEWYDIISRTTTVRTFNHNGFLSLWYRFGLWGLVLMLTVWGSSLWNGIVAFRRQHAALAVRLAGLATAAALFAYALPANTSNPFFRDDGTFLLALLFGLAAGVRARATASDA